MNNYQKAIMSVLCLLMFHCGRVSFHKGMCVCVTHCVAGFESLFFPSGGSQGEITLPGVRREESGKDYLELVEGGYDGRVES